MSSAYVACFALAPPKQAGDHSPSTSDIPAQHLCSQLVAHQLLVTWFWYLLSLSFLFKRISNGKIDPESMCAQLCWLTQWTVCSMLGSPVAFSRQESGSGLPFPSWDVPDPGI